ncbi:hypothetical protein Tco_0626417 [Tanacetum coccineum]|uniref:Uncharacterized protein n=1 Tax=Tanacetum coccineum TaxID=301880 RepID=A0ABQ4WJJ8_9ASTR
MESLNSNSQERELHQLRQMQHKAKESCMKSFRLLHSFLQVLSYNELKINGCFERAFQTFFEQDVQTLTGSMLLHLDQLEKQLGKEEFQETGSMDAFKELKTRFQLLISFQYNFDYFDDLMIHKYFLAYTRTEVQQFRNTLIQHMEFVKKSIIERAKHKREYDSRMNDRQMQSKEKKKLQIQEVQSNTVHELKVDSVLMKNTCSRKENGTSETASSKTVKESSFDSATKEVHAIKFKMSKAKEICMTHEGKVDSSEALDVSLVVTECSETKSEKHVTRSRYGNDTHAADANMKPVNDKEPMAEVQLTAAQNVLVNEQQHSEQSEPIYDIHLLEKVDSNTTPDSANMSHRGGEIDQDAEHPLLNAELIKTKDMINDLKAQLQAKTTLICNLKNQIKSVKEASNEVKVKNDIDVIETINIELEHSVAKLLAANEQLHKENEHLKQTYKELYDSIKKSRVQNKDNSDSLISQINQKSVENADLKAQIQEKVFANAAFKNEMRKLKGNSVDTKISRPRFASKVDEKNDLSKTVTPHYLPKVRESAPAKPHHVNAPSSSRNSQKESYGSNDMAHTYFLEEGRKKTQKRNRIPIPRDMASARRHRTPNTCTPNPMNISSSSLVPQCQMASIGKTSGLAPQRKENCMLQCALSLKEISWEIAAWQQFGGLFF